MLDDEIKSFENKLQQDAAGKLELLFILEVMARLSKFSDKFGCPWFKPGLAFVSVGKVFLTTVSYYIARYIKCSLEVNPSDWFFLGRNFAILTVSMKMAINCDCIFFCF